MSTDRDLLAASDLFDSAFYLDQNPDVASAGLDPIDHYLAYGWREGRRPHLAFDGSWYLRQNPDVVQADLNPLVHYLTVGRPEGRRGHKRTVVYTAITGNYDELCPPLGIDPEIDFVVFTDDWLVEVPGPWIRCRVTDVRRSDRLTARYIKTHPHVLLPMYEVSVWMDAKFRPMMLRAEALHASLGDAAIAFFAHHQRDCAYAEAAVVREHRLDAAERVDAMVRLLHTEGYPEHAGLVEGGFIIRRHADAGLVSAMERWWELISTVSERDQLSINFVLRHSGIAHATIPGVIWSNESVEWIGHRPRQWKGLRCGGAYLDVEEYEAIEQMVTDLGIQSAIETCAGETSILFSMLGVQALSIEHAPGPWSRRAAARGCRVAVVPFDEALRRYAPVELEAGLRGVERADLLLIDSPIGTANRAHILTQIRSLVPVRYVLYHDVRRDVVNIFSDRDAFGMRLVRFVDSPRGLVLFEVANE